MTRDGRPASPEELAERYAGRWMIGQDVNWDGTRQWVADPRSPEDQRLTAHSIDRLAEQLERAVGS